MHETPDLVFVQARRWAEKEDALKQGLPAAGNVEFAEEIDKNLALSTAGGHYQGKR